MYAESYATAAITNKGQTQDKEVIEKGLRENKWQRFDEFSKELEPIVTQLNELMTKYKIHPIEDFISFPVNKKINKIQPFISYEMFPFSETKEELK